MNIYIAGKITNNPYYATHFGKVQAGLEECGHVVLTPCNLPIGLTQDEYMHICLAMIDVAEGVMFLDNWTDSKGATTEHEYAIKNNKKKFYESDKSIYWDQLR